MALVPSEFITLRIDHNITYLDGRMESSVYKKFRQELGYRPENAFFMIKNINEKIEEEVKKNADKAKSLEWKKDWDGMISTVCFSRYSCHCSVKKDGIHFPTGLLSKAIEFFKNYGVIYKLIDIRIKTERTNNFSMSSDFEIRDYQTDIINKVKGVNGKKGVDRGIIKVATGGGKTGISCGIISAIGVVPVIFFVPSIDLLVQTKKEIEKFVRYNGEKITVGMVGGGYKDIQPITVMTIQTAVRALGGVWVKYDDEDYNDDDTDISDKRDSIKNLIQTAKLMICDEVQHWAAETCQIISDYSSSCQYRYGMSATPWRDMGDDILIDGCFGRCISDISASHLIRQGYLVKPTIIFHNMKNLFGIRKVCYTTVYRMGIVENETRNRCIVDSALSFKEQGRNILILVKHISHGKLLESVIPGSIFLYGGTSKKKRLAHLEKMKAGEHQITIASVIFDEGIDCRPLDALILAGSGKSPTRALQRIGRILRKNPGKDGAIVVDFMDHCKYLKEHSNARMKMYEKEEEFEIKVANENG